MTGVLEDKTDQNHTDINSMNLVYSVSSLQRATKEPVGPDYKCPDF